MLHLSSYIAIVPLGLLLTLDMFMRNFIPKFLLALACCWSTFIVVAQPVISGLSPSAAASGATVSINGSGFSSVPLNNLVYFGATRATVTAASSSGLTVTVPPGASYQPVTVTVNGLTAVSAKPFNITIPGVGLFTSNSLQPGAGNYFETCLYPRTVSAADIDGDGKPDLVTPGNYNNPYATFSVLRNTGSKGKVSFAPKVEFQTGDMAAALTTADLDGDGLLDVIATSGTNQGISVFRNLSTPGNIAFGAMQSFPTGSNAWSIAIADFDLDGHVDIAVSNYMSNTISVLKNTSTIGNISLAAKMDLMTGLAPRSVVATDLDNDGKADLVVSNELSNTLSVYKNNSAGSPAFAWVLDIATAANPWGVTAGDLNNDGKDEIVVACNGANAVSVYQNSGRFIFGSAYNLYNASSPSAVYIDDINGDGKPDLMAAANSCAFWPNNNSGTSVSLGAVIYLGYPAYNMSAADVDMDGKTDIIGVNISLSRVNISRNKCNEPIIYYLSPTSAAAGQTVAIMGENLAGISSVNFGGQAAASFTVASSTRVNAVVGSGYSGSVDIQNTLGSTSIAGFTFLGPPVITSFTPTTAGPNARVGINGKNFSNINLVRFGGVNAQSFNVESTDSITAYVSSGATGSVEVVNSYGTGTKTGFTYLPPPTVTSFSPTTATTGTTVTINGTNFNNATGVYFGSVQAASFTVVSPTKITAVLGSGTTGYVRVETAGGTDSLSGFSHAPTITSFTPTSADGGSSITINGFGFINVTSVVIGTYGASYTVNSSTKITVTVPPSTSSGSVTVTTWAGTATLAGFNFIPAPTISTYYPKLTGAGGSVLITGQNFTNVSAVRFGGVAATSFVVNSPTSITAIVPATTSGTVTVTTSPGGTATANGFIYISTPVISSFSPESGVIGTTVSLFGAGFSTTTNDNNVYFGPVKATVLSATANTLTVKVPAGSTVSRISVSVNGYNTLTLKPFITRFTGGTITPNSLLRQDLASSAYPVSVTAGDFDGDGKPDLAVTHGAWYIPNSNSNVISIYKNTSTPGVISFATPVNIIGGFNGRSIIAGDVDGDGKLDIVYLSHAGGNPDGDSIYVHRNISTPGNISFDPYQRTVTGFVPEQIVLADINSDGKPDFCVINSGEGAGGSGYFRMPLTRNLSTPGNISFGPRDYYQSMQSSGSSSYYPNSITSTDFDADGRPDLVAGGSSAGFVTIMRNATIPGSTLFSLGPWYMNASGMGGGFDLAVADDFNGNNVVDVVCSYMIFTDVTPPNNTQMTQGLGVYGVSVEGDFDGDGRIDLASPGNQSTTVNGTVRIRRNASTAATVIFEKDVPFATNLNPLAIASTDFDLDGKPDIAVVNFNSDNVSVYRNKVGEPLSVCPGGSLSITSEKTGTNYQWQVNTGSGFSNITANSNYSGVTTATLGLQNLPSSFDRYQYRCVVDGNYTTTYSIQFLNTWTGSVNTSWENPGNWSCGTIPDNNTDVILTTGNITINSNVTVRTLYVGPSANVTVSPGFKLTILK